MIPRCRDIYGILWKLDRYTPEWKSDSLNEESTKFKSVITNSILSQDKSPDRILLFFSP